jgi:hypothetical protein
MPLVLLSPESTRTTLKDNAAGIAAPWILIQAEIFKFADLLRAKNILFANVDDTLTIRTIMPGITGGKNVAFAVNGGNAMILNCGAAQKLLAVHGKTALGMKWAFVEGHVLKFLSYLYTQNVVIVEADGLSGPYIVEKSAGKNISVRMREATYGEHGESNVD